MTQTHITQTCTKCGRELPRPAYAPALCGKCDLVERLTVEQYSRPPGHPPIMPDDPPHIPGEE